MSRCAFSAWAGAAMEMSAVAASARMLRRRPMRTTLRAAPARPQGAASAPQPVEQAQWQEAQHRRPPLQRLAVLAVERGGVAGGVGGARVHLLAARSAAPLTLPVHDSAVAREAEAVAERAAGEHPPSVAGIA